MFLCPYVLLFTALAADKTRYGIGTLNKPRKDCNLWGLRLARLVNINRVLIYEDSGEY